MVGLALEWQYFRVRSTSAVNSGWRPIADLPVDTTLKRTIVTWYYDMLSTDLESVEFWTEVPIISTVELTYGSPPPFPDDPGTTSMDGRDFVHVEVNTQTATNQTADGYMVTSAPHNGAIRVVDTPVQRKPTTEPAQVWFSWGAMGVSSYPPEGTLLRMVSACLVDTPA